VRCVTTSPQVKESGRERKQEHKGKPKIDLGCLTDPQSQWKSQINTGCRSYECKTDKGDTIHEVRK